MKSEQKILKDSTVRLRKDVKTLQKKVDQIIEEDPDVQENQDELGVPGGRWDFENFDVEVCQNKLDKLRKVQDYLYKRVNPNIEKICAKITGEYDALKERRECIISDKDKLLDTVQKLDVKRIETLRDAYVKVNEHFAAIFSTFLPKATADLQFLDHFDVNKGLRLRVGFGKMWKNSLSELSGGQRSLLALSYLLALLRYKPAPFYIFDEIDAALDLSHTENIGRMIRTHFANSQFIVVSLKEEFYQKAKILFKIEQNNGVSEVSRTEQNYIEKEDFDDRFEMDENNAEHEEMIEQEAPFEQELPMEHDQLFEQLVGPEENSNGKSNANQVEKSSDKQEQSKEAQVPEEEENSNEQNAQIPRETDKIQESEANQPEAPSENYSESIKVEETSEKIVQEDQPQNENPELKNENPRQENNNLPQEEVVNTVEQVPQETQHVEAEATQQINERIPETQQIIEPIPQTQLIEEPRIPETQPVEDSGSSFQGTQMLDG